MRLLYGSVFGGFLLCTLCGSSWALTSVLLPKDTTDDPASLPNLGLTVRSPEPHTSSSASKAENPLLPDLSAQAQPIPSASEKPSLQIIDREDSARSKDRPGKERPYELTVSLGKNSRYGAVDIATIQRKLGVRRQKIAKACRLSFRGTLWTTDGMFAVRESAAPTLRVPYGGTIKTASLTAKALCRIEKDDLPSNLERVVRVSGLYEVSLKAFKCRAPSGSRAKTLTITYNGNTDATCDYE
ncbi:MAG: hypothetical protein PHS57_09545 [Alphaproteobacteria bacterium]|nr:hypothetical protein [Alphaproteobacteria bacterium]